MILPHSESLGAFFVAIRSTGCLRDMDMDVEVANLLSVYRVQHHHQSISDDDISQPGLFWNGPKLLRLTIRTVGSNRDQGCTMAIADGPPVLVGRSSAGMTGVAPGDHSIDCTVYYCVQQTLTTINNY